MISFLPLRAINQRYEPALSAGLARVVSSGRYLLGREVAAFEQEWAKACGVRHCVGVGNGLDALTLILTALKQLRGWQDGDGVLVPAFTFVATAEAVDRAGLRPVFCDVTAAKPLVSADEVARLCRSEAGSSLRALVPVHLYGRMCAMDALMEVARRHNLLIVEDACQAHGATLHGRPAGSYGVAAAFSFYPGKNLGALGDGGAVVTNDEELAQRVRSLANYGAERKYYHEFQGQNSRLDELQAAVLRSKLPHLASDNAHRRRLADLYTEGLGRLYAADGNRADVGENPVYHIYPIRTERRAAMQEALLSAGIETLVHYPVALHRQPCYRKYAQQRFPEAERWAATELSIPVSPILTPEEAEEVMAALRRFSAGGT
ncbi:MAG: DegT/DnrJ/EryC1/StrS family aminotransferase [Alloprevotella sp.]